MAADSKENVLARIQRALGDIQEIRNICRVPSLSFGVYILIDYYFNFEQPITSLNRLEIARRSNCSPLDSEKRKG